MSLVKSDKVSVEVGGTNYKSTYSILEYKIFAMDLHHFQLKNNKKIFPPSHLRQRTFQPANQPY